MFSFFFDVRSTCNVPAGFLFLQISCESHIQKGAIKPQHPNFNCLEELYQTSKVMCDDTGFASIDRCGFTLKALCGKTWAITLKLISVCDHTHPASVGATSLDKW